LSHQGQAERKIDLTRDIQEIIIQNLNELKPYLLKNKICAYRLLTSSFSLPVTIDIYQDNAVIHVFDSNTLSLLSEIEKALIDVLQIKDFFYKKNSREDFDLPKSNQKKIVLDEYGCKFLINLSDYLDTGLFLDHRETRKWIAGESKNKVVLNTFAYTGSFTVYAALAGAAKTYSVDISSVYCEWIKENLALNNLSIEDNWVSKMDTLEFFKYAKKKNLLFDIIILDPPTFSNNKGKSFSVQRDHPTLINYALGLLSPSGFILFSNNYREFRMLQKELQPCIVKEKSDLIPPDFSGSCPHRSFIISKRN
jgi:23S rRNA G2069 N7-methylase RlmK/C1962 C5-methylase RlmI